MYFFIRKRKDESSSNNYSWDVKKKKTERGEREGEKREGEI
jgi:hypothetical protein